MLPEAVGWTIKRARMPLCRFKPQLIVRISAPYGGVYKGVPVVTIELRNATRTPLDAETRQMWLDLKRWMSERMGRGGAERLPRAP